MSYARAMITGVVDRSDVFQATDITSNAMKEAIAEWFDLYYRKNADEKENTCQQIPYTIVRKLTKTVFAEYQASSQDTFARGVLEALIETQGEAMQTALIGGECLIKPVPAKNSFYFTVIPRNNLQVFGRDITGAPTDIGTEEKSTFGKHFYTFLERRTVDEKGFLTIRNYLYRSTTERELGTRTSLASHPRYALLEDEFTFPRPVGSIGLVRMKTPMVNSIDGSKDGISVYAAATGLIRCINQNEAQLDGEFSRGESRILASKDLIKRKNGVNQIESHLFTALDGDAEEIGINIFSPELREKSFLARKQEYLRNIENVIGLKRGLLSEVEAAERTATEITSSAGEYNLTIIDFQKMWEYTLKEIFRVCGILGEMYKVAGAHAVDMDDVVIAWGNGVLYDEAKTNMELLSQVQSGLLKPERYMGWYHNLPCETEEERAAIRKNYMPELESLEAGE